jgi:hypothetical protein
MSLARELGNADRLGVDPNGFAAHVAVRRISSHAQRRAGFMA